jgi:hypothetical protein
VKWKLLLAILAGAIISSCLPMPAMSQVIVRRVVRSSPLVLPVRSTPLALPVSRSASVVRSAPQSVPANSGWRYEGTQLVDSDGAPIVSTVNQPLARNVITRPAAPPLVRSIPADEAWVYSTPAPAPQVVSRSAPAPSWWSRLFSSPAPVAPPGVEPVCSGGT